MYRFLSEQAGQGDLSRLGPDRVADADIDMKRFPCACQPREQPDPHAAVLIFVTDCLSGYIFQVKRKAVIQFSWQCRAGHGDDELPDVLHLI